MLRSTWKLQLMTVGVVTFFSSKTLFAKDEAVEEAANKITSLIKTAISGGEGSSDAINELVQNYIAPAFFIVVVAVISYMVASAIGRYVGGMVAKRVDLTLGKFLTKAVRNLLMLVVAMGVLSFYNVDITSLAAILAAVGFAVGMALQGTLGNFASGVMLLLFRPFKVEDYIVVADTEGTVEEIDLFTTRVNTLDNRHVIIPNGEIFGSKLENYTRNPLRRVDVNVGAAYSADLAQTREALNRAVANVGAVASPAPQVYLMELGASSVDWQIRAWCAPQDYWAVREALVTAAKVNLDRAGIGIPYPQLDVHVGGKLLAKAA
jgi:small conductance mechanosensitive channel